MFGNCALARFEDRVATHCRMEAASSSVDLTASSELMADRRQWAKLEGAEALKAEMSCRCGASVQMWRQARMDWTVERSYLGSAALPGRFWELHRSNTSCSSYISSLRPPFEGQLQAWRLETPILGFPNVAGEANVHLSLHRGLLRVDNSLPSPRYLNQPAHPSHTYTHALGVRRSTEQLPMKSVSDGR